MTDEELKAFLASIRDEATAAFNYACGIEIETVRSNFHHGPINESCKRGARVAIDEPSVMKSHVIETSKIFGRAKRKAINKVSSSPEAGKRLVYFENWPISMCVRNGHIFMSDRGKAMWVDDEYMERERRMMAAA